MDDIATLALKIKSDDALHSLDAVSKKTANLGDIAKQTATAFGSMFIGSKIAGFGKEMLMAASDLQEAGGKMEAVFKSQTASAERYVSSLVDSFNFSRKQASDSLSTMADIFQKTGIDIKTSMQYAFDLNKQAADIDAFSNVVGGVDRVTHALTSAMLGETEAAKSLGVVVKQEYVNAQMLADKQKGLTFATEAAAQAHARFQVIMRSSANATGQVAREGDNFGNQLRKLKAGVDDLKTSFGTALVGPATTVVRTLKTAADTLNAMSPAAKNAVVVAGALGTAFVAVGVPIAKLVVGFKAYRAIQKHTEAATKSNEKSTKEMTIAELNQIEAEKIAAATTNISTAATKRETVAINANTAAQERNNAAKRGKKTGVPDVQDGLGERLKGPSKRERKLSRKTDRERRYESFRKSRAKETLAPRRRGMRSAESFRSAMEGGLGLKKRRPIVRAASTFGSKASVAARAKRLAGLKDIALKSLTFSKQFMSLGSVIGKLAGPVGIAITALEMFRHAPKWVEEFADKTWPKIKEFFSVLPGKIGGWISSAWTGTTEWLGEALLGAGQTIKRLAGFETEASKEYELNKQIEENNKKREKILQFKLKNEELEGRISVATQSRLTANKNAFMGYLAGKAPETMKLAAAQSDFGRTNQSMVDKKGELQEIKRKMRENKEFGFAHPESMDMLNAENEQLAEKAEKLNKELETLGETWANQAKTVDELSKAVSDAMDQIRESQKRFQDNLDQNRENEENYQRNRRLGKAKSDIGKRAILEEEQTYQEGKILEADAAQDKALKANEKLKLKVGEVYDGQKMKNMSEMKQIIESGDVTPEKQKRYRELYEQTSGRFNSTRDSDFSIDFMQSSYGDLQSNQEKVGKDIDKLTKERDENQAIADTKLSHVQERDQAKDQLEEITKAAKDKEFSMKTQDQQIASVRSEYADFQSKAKEYENKKAASDRLGKEISELEAKKQGGTITAEEEKALKDKTWRKGMIGDWITKNQGDYDKAVDEREGKKNQLDELLRPIAEKNFEEIDSARKASGKPIGPQSAMEAGSSAAFQIQNRVYNQYQKTIEQQTKNIADYLKAMRDKMLEETDSAVAVEVE